MSAGGPFALILMLYLTLAPSCLAAARSDIASNGTFGSQSEAQPTAPGSSSEDSAATAGTVQRALERLYTVPRPATRPARYATTEWIVPGTADRPTTKPAPAQRAAWADGYQETPAAAGFYYYPGRRLPRSEREWSDYRYFEGRPSRYGYGRYDFGDGYAGSWFRHGFMKGYNTGQFDKTATERQERVLTHAHGHLERGLECFREGKYREAADAFKLAAESNQGDPAARLYAAHALFTTGQYREAVKYLRRAFELQPKIALLDFDIRDDYGRKADFDQHLQALETASRQAPDNIDRLITLGYVRYYTHQRDNAYEALAKAAKLDTRDRLVQRLIENCHVPDVSLDR